MRKSALIGMLAAMAVPIVGSSACAPEATTAIDVNALAEGSYPAPAGNELTIGAAAAATGRYFGAAIDVNALAEGPYRALAGNELTAVTPENAMKWGEVEPQRGVFDWRPADELVGFAKAHGQKIRGHTLVWHGQLPSWFVDGNFAPNEVKALMLAHVSTEVGRFKGSIYAWDVVNEPLADNGGWRDNIFLKAMGPDYVSLALNAAHKADPGAKLYVNEYGVETSGPKMEALYDLVASLKRDGVPIDGVGLQCHLVSGAAPGDLPDVMRRFASLGVDVAVTELDLRIRSPATERDLQTQAADYARVVSACRMTKRCVGATAWGITDGHSWIPGFFQGYGAALPFDEGYRPKPAVAAILKAFAAPGP